MMIKHTLFALFLLVCAVIIFIPALIIGSVGAHLLIQTRHEERVYTNTTCFVSNVTEENLSYDCNCDGCHPATCYAEHFAVRYEIENGTTISGIIHMDETPRLLNVQMNNNYTCYYDRMNVYKVQWTMPNERPALAMLIVGFTVTGLVIISVVIGLIKWIIDERYALSNPHVKI